MVKICVVCIDKVEIRGEWKTLEKEELLLVQREGQEGICPECEREHAPSQNHIPIF